MPMILHAQQPFDLDPSFRANFNDWSVTSILQLGDGDVIISGQIKFSGDLYFRSGARLNSDGSRDLSFANVTYMGGKLTRWNDLVYAQNGIGMRRLDLDGDLDNSFNMVNAPHFMALQGGDYHVYPDGRILMGGVHQVNYPDSNWVGFYNLIWFSNEGYLDTTRAPHGGDGAIDHFLELPDGKFICSGAMSQYDGRPTSNIFRVQADGALDTTFSTGTIWGGGFCFLPLTDGRCYVGGMFKTASSVDTLQLVRLMPDGTLDPSFNNTLRFGIAPPIVNPWNIGAVESITPLDAGRLIVTGYFRDVDGTLRGGICLVDTNGTLLNDHFGSGGCGFYTYGGTTGADISGIHFMADSMCYIWGAYHGYDDGTTNDPLQRFVTRLYGPDFSTGVAQQAEPINGLSVYPNPASGAVTIAFDTGTIQGAGAIEVRDIFGRVVHRATVSGSKGQVVWDCRSIPAGTYTTLLRSATGTQLVVERIIVQP